MQKERKKKLLDLIIKAAEEKKAEDIQVLDVRKNSKVVDYLLICSGESEPQIRAISKYIDEKLRKNKIKGFRWEGGVSSGWRVLDLGEIIIHVMGTAEREYYNLEELWGKEAIVYHY